MHVCTRVPCGMNSAGYCANCGMQQIMPPSAPMWQAPAAPMGCICPPTSEQTCKSPICARQPYRVAVSAAMPPAIGEEQIKHMVDRFLMWRLPEDFNPDNGISFDPIAGKGTMYASQRHPVGTNLFTATQAEAMVRHMIEGLK